LQAVVAVEPTVEEVLPLVAQAVQEEVVQV
jgi:hypothetical protein